MTKADAFLRTSAWIERFARALRGVHDGIWLGLLTRDDLNEITDRAYSRSPMYADEEYNLSGLFAWERAAVDTFFQGCRSILVGAAGGGREVIALARRGFRVDGFECNARLLALARSLVDREGLSAGLVPAPCDAIPASLGGYDAGIVGYGAYRHLAGRDTRIRFLSDFRRHLRADAPIILSFQLRGESRRDRLALRTAALVGSVRRNPLPAQLGDVLDGRFEHRFTGEEIRSELEDAGYRMAHFDGGLASHAVARVVAAV